MPRFVAPDPPSTHSDVISLRQNGLEIAQDASDLKYQITES